MKRVCQNADRVRAEEKATLTGFELRAVVLCPKVYPELSLVFSSVSLPSSPPQQLLVVVVGGGVLRPNTRSPTLAICTRHDARTHNPTEDEPMARARRSRRSDTRLLLLLQGAINARLTPRKGAPTARRCSSCSGSCCRRHRPLSVYMLRMRRRP